jgi:hypothetical protein
LNPALHFVARIFVATELCAELQRVGNFFSSTLNTLLEEFRVAHDIAEPILAHLTSVADAAEAGSHKTLKSARSSSQLYEAKQHPLLESGYHGLASAPSVVTTPSMKSAVELRETSALLTDQHSDVRTREGFKRMLTDLYRTATLLQNFQTLNHTGFVKLFKRLARPCFPSTLRPEVRWLLIIVPCCCECHAVPDPR